MIDCKYTSSSKVMGNYCVFSPFLSILVEEHQLMLTLFTSDIAILAGMETFVIKVPSVPCE